MQLINKEIDLTQFPTDICTPVANQPKEHTFGDLHGNTIKLVHLLVQQGVMQMTPEDYQAFRACYDYFEKIDSRSGLSTQLDAIVGQLNNVKDILNRATFSNIDKVRLIGDEIGDRGANDYLTLLLLAKLRNQGVDTEVLLSNHGVETYHAYEMLKTGKATELTAPLLTWGHAASLSALNEIFFKTGIVSKDDFCELMETAYQPSLKLIGYTVGAESKEICFYSHAGIDQTVIEHIAKKLGAQYDWANIQTKTATIDRINAKFAEHVRNNTVHTLYDHQGMMQGYEGQTPLDPAQDPLAFLMWNRFYEDKMRAGQPVLNRVTVHNDEKQFYTHGHDPNDSNQSAQIFSIDDRVGKYGANQGTIHIVQGPYQPVPQQQNTVAAKFFEPSVAPDAIPEQFAKPQQAALVQPQPRRVVSPIKESAFPDFSKKNDYPFGAIDKKIHLKTTRQPSRFAKNNAGFFAATGTGAVVGAALLAALITTAVVSLGASLGIGLAVIALGLVIGLIIKAVQHHKNNQIDPQKYQPLSPALLPV